MEINKIYNEECIAGMAARIPDGSIDLILCDLPYQVTANKWDVLIPFDQLWAQYERIIKPNGAIVLTATQPFTSALITSNPKLFRYEWIWDKVRGSNFQNARRQPMKSHENICVFYKKQPTYNPQFWFSTPYKTPAGKRSKEIEGLSGGSAANMRTESVSEDGRRYPLTIQTFRRDSDRVHPTQKPVALMEYLIKTYTNPGDIVLDNCLGSGTTAVAAIRSGRNYIGFEMDPHYFEICEKRIAAEQDIKGESQ